MINSPQPRESGENQPQRPRGIFDKIKDVSRRALKTLLQPEYEKLGLTLDEVKAIKQKYTEMSRGYGKSATKAVMKKRKNGELGFMEAAGQLMEAGGAFAETERRFDVLDSLLEEFGYRDNPKIRMFFISELGLINEGLA